MQNTRKMQLNDKLFIAIFKINVNSKQKFIFYFQRKSFFKIYNVFNLCC